MSAPLHCTVVGFLLAMMTGAGAFAQEAADVEKTELAGLLEAARLYEMRVGNKPQVAALREPALLNFTNPERNQERGSVFVWMLEGRPAAVGQFFRFNAFNGERVTKHAFHSLSATSLRAVYEDAVAWAPSASGVKWQWAEDAPVPAETPNARMLQMRQLARRFRVTLTNPKNERTELRLTPRPLLEYAAPAENVLSGALLSFVIATDPEAILIVEAVEDAGQRRFRYAFARFHFQQLSATDDDTEVWHVDYDPSLMRNNPGDPATMGKIYTSFYR